MNRFKVILSITLAFISINGFSQLCKDFHKSKDCYIYIPEDRDFQEYNQARSTTTAIGKTNIYKMVLYGPKDYIVGICAESAYYRQIHFRIIDGITHKVLFDNKDQGYIESFGFTVLKTQPLDIEVTVLAKDKNAQQKTICIGIAVLWSKIVETNGKEKK
jgi:hypothetical protein